MTLPLGILTTDDCLVVRTWDGWLARATGIEPAQALDRPLVDVMPEIRTRGLLPIIETVLARGTAEVLAPAFHRYLFSCPPSEPSAVFDRMQQHVTIGPLREDGRIVGVVVTVEDVTRRLERERELAERLKRDRHSSTVDADTLAAMLDTNDWRDRRAAVTALAAHAGAIVDALVDTIRAQHGNFNVLSSTLDLLAVSDIDVLAPLIRCLGDEDANLRIQAALILGERRDRRAIPALIARLTDPDVNVRFHAIEALGRVHATEAADALVAIAEERDFFLAFPAIQALTRVGTPAVAPRLVPLLADEMLRAPVIEVLGELGDDGVTLPLVQLLNSSDAPSEVIADALAGLWERYESRYGAGDHIADLTRRTITATGTQRILDAVERVDPERLAGLARVLGWLEGEAVQRALTRLLGRDRVRSQIVEALVRYGAGVVPLLVEQMRAEDLETRQAAAVALGRIGDRHATPALVRGLDDPELAVAAAGALARLGDPQAFEPLMALLGTSDSGIRQAAIAALNSIGHPSMPARIAPLLEDPNPLVRESAAKIAGYFGYPECVEAMLRRCGDEDVSVRRTAVEHLALFDDPRVFPALAEALQSEAAVVRAAAVAAIARTDHPARDQVLRQTLQDPDAWVRYLAVRALGASADSRTGADMKRLLETDPAAHVRLAAIEAIGRLKPEDALEILEPLTRADNEDIARAAIAALGHVEERRALAVLETFLRAPQPWRQMAAVDALALRRDESVPDMLQWVAAGAEDRAVSATAVDALARIAAREDTHGAVATLALLAAAAEPRLRDLVVAALGSLPARRVTDVATGLRHPGTDVRRATVEALSRMKQPAASRALAAALDDAAPNVRLAAVGELKFLGTRSAQRKLMALARTDPDEDVRRAALVAVARPHEDDRNGIGTR